MCKRGAARRKIEISTSSDTASETSCAHQVFLSIVKNHIHYVDSDNSSGSEDDSAVTVTITVTASADTEHKAPRRTRSLRREQEAVDSSTLHTLHILQSCIYNSDRKCKVINCKTTL